MKHWLKRIGLVFATMLMLTGALSAPAQAQPQTSEQTASAAVALAEALVAPQTPQMQTGSASAMIVNDCKTGQFCVWKNAYYMGLPDYYWTIAGGSGGYCIEFGGTLNDNVDSAVIKHGSQNPRSATLYEHAGCTGTPVYFLAPSVYGGPQAGSCHDSGTDNWAPNWSLPGKLPSSVWIIRG